MDNGGKPTDNLHHLSSVETYLEQSAFMLREWTLWIYTDVPMSSRPTMEGVIGVQSTDDGSSPFRPSPCFVLICMSFLELLTCCVVVYSLLFHKKYLHVVLMTIYICYCYYCGDYYLLCWIQMIPFDSTLLSFWFIVIIVVIIICFAEYKWILLIQFCYPFDWTTSHYSND